MAAAATDSALGPVVARVDGILEAFLAGRHEEALDVDRRTVEPVEEIQRLVRAGGKRLRPAGTYWGYRAAGGADGPEIWQAAASVELLHTMALLHDDVMDGDDVRRGQPSARARQIAAAKDRGQADPERVGDAVAIVAGDLAAAFAEQLFSTAGFPDDRQAAGSARLARMRLELALGAYLSVADLDGVDPATVAYLKGGAYTVEGPVLLGSALAGGGPEVDDALRAFARPLGAAFQLLDDLADGDAAPGASRAEAAALVTASRRALADLRLDRTAAEALDELAALVGSL
ncbi:MAG TPA: polyprenyl synthetase family protein [Actinomycetota bacterium]|jgi:geranylgeranyl diphosphate synthase type I|nr:polyprenyl synthetase family protein [Actinomycetota bacterium]